MKKPIADFEIVDHGIEHEQYWQGCGVAFTKFDHVSTGAGWNPAEAIEDALEGLACCGWDCDGMDERILAYLGVEYLPTEPTTEDREDCYYYVSIRVA